MDDDVVVEQLVTELFDSIDNCFFLNSASRRGPGDAERRAKFGGFNNW